MTSSNITPTSSKDSAEYFDNIIIKTYQRVTIATINTFISPTKINGTCTIKPSEEQLLDLYI